MMNNSKLNGWGKALQVILTTLAGAAFVAILIMGQNVGEIRRGQEAALTHLIEHIDRMDERSTTRHGAILNICLTMEQRMCDRLCKERRE